MPAIAESRILIMATHGYEESTLNGPRDELSAQGAKADVAAPEAGEIKGWRNDDWGSSVTADATFEEVKVGEYDALVLPGGLMAQDALRIDDAAIAIIKAFLEMDKVVAAMCHAPALLIEAGAVKGRDVTSYLSIRTDMINAGGRWVDHQVVAAQGIITSRHPADLDGFIAEIAEQVKKGPQPSTS